MKSVMHDKKDGTCYLCTMLHGDYSRKTTQEHHVFYGTANRRLSERYGLKVYLCLAHHEYGPEAVHQKQELSLMLKKKAQKAFMERWPEMNFRSIFGKDVLDEAGRQQSCGTGLGFSFMEEPLSHSGVSL